MVNIHQIVVDLSIQHCLTYLNNILVGPSFSQGCLQPSRDEVSPGDALWLAGSPLFARSASAMGVVSRLDLVAIDWCRSHVSVQVFDEKTSI